MFFGHSWVILIIILLLVLIVVGPGKLGQLGGAIGRSINDFRKTQREEQLKQSAGAERDKNKTP